MGTADRLTDKTRASRPSSRSDARAFPDRSRGFGAVPRAAHTPESPHRSNPRRPLVARNTGRPNSASRFLSSPLATAERERFFLGIKRAATRLLPEERSRLERLTRWAVWRWLPTSPASSVVHQRGPGPIDSQAVEDVTRAPRLLRADVASTGRSRSKALVQKLALVHQLASGNQQETHLWLFFEPSFSRRATVSGNGWTRCTGPFAMSATVWPSRFTRVTSAPFETR